MMTSPRIALSCPGWLALGLAVALGLTACGGSSAGASDESSNAPAETAASAENLPVEEIVATMQFSGAKLTADNAAQAKAAVRSGMPIREAVQAVGEIAGAPKQAGSGVANWLARTDDGGCLNLMLMTGDGVVRNTSLDTFPKGSMGEAKCQNYGL